MSAGETITVRRMQPLLGTWVEIRATGRAGRVERAVRAAFLHLARVQQRMSFHAPDSVLTRINLHAHRQPQPVDALTWDVLRKALALSRASAGCFDITVAGRLVARGLLPDHGFATLDAPPGADAVALLPGRRVALRRPVLLTLDGIAKGYAVDRAIDALARAGVQQAVVNAGGDLRVFGPQALPLGIRCADGAIRDAGLLRNAAVASSAIGLGAAARARFPGCVIHPAGKEPAQRVPRVWSVRAAQCWRADALTKVAALAAPAQREALLARLGGTLVQSAPQGVA
ncbi:MAG: FAD:protein FMN transferase [Thiomonas sp.]